MNRDIMSLGDISSERIEFRSVEDSDIDLIHQHQNGGCREDISEMLDFDATWAPMSKAQVKEKVDEMRKEERKLMFAIWTRGKGDVEDQGGKDGQCIGLADYNARWDPWAPHFGVLIWPEVRRKGYGRETALLLMKATFGRSLAHNLSGWCAEWNKAGIAFAEALGFSRAGVMRQCAVRDGKLVNALFFDMLRPEYLAKYGPGGEG